MLFFIIVALASSTFETKEERSMFLFFMRATERLSFVDGDDENANSDTADCKIGGNNESPTPRATKRKRKRGEFARTPSLVMYLLYTKPHLF
jgi:hypothetical protein